MNESVKKEQWTRLREEKYGGNRKTSNNFVTFIGV